jgi:hypothetical protein
MIITKIQGGLGNQLFQWAYGKSLSVKNNTELRLDLSFYQNQIGNTPRQFDLYNFPNITKLNSVIDTNNSIPVIDDFNYKEIKYNDHLNYYLNGYWQSEKYFLDISEIIKKELSIDDKTNQNLLKYINGDTVSLHIRRTDYVTSNGYHPVLPIEYYNLALEIIEKYDTLLIFSDDINWCKENLSFKNMVFIENQTNIEDLWLMSLCKHNVIANSSFSWWGAWLNNNKDKIVIAPKIWFGDVTNLNQKNILPNNWLKL